MTETKNILAIDIGGSKILVGIVDIDGNILCQKRADVNETYNSDSDKVFSVIFEIVRELQEEYPDIDPCAIGATIPGLADVKNGIWKYSPFSGIQDVQISKILYEELQIPVYIQNDVTACALAEKIYGNCRGVTDYMWITVSNGIGGGLVLNGELYEGAFKNAGEIGHVNVVENGELCVCGNRGCLEAYASGASIAKRYLSKSKGNLNRHGEKITSKYIAELARRGDALANEVFQNAGYRLGVGIACVINLLNLQKVVIGGGISGAMDLFMPELERAVNNLVFKMANHEYSIEKTALGYEAALVGAATIAQKELGWINE